jgi:hypothetical protein
MLTVVAPQVKIAALRKDSGFLSVIGFSSSVGPGAGTGREV